MIIAITADRICNDISAETARMSNAAMSSGTLSRADVEQQ
jgi:hypothetical protein